MAQQVGALDSLGDQYFRPQRGRFAAVWEFARTRPLGAVCLVILSGVVLVAVFAGAIAPHPPNESSLIDKLQSPSNEHLLGTDNFGRDVLSRIIYGGRVSMQVGFISMAVAVIVSVAFGISGAYFGGVLDFLVGRIVELVQALPGIVLLITLLALFGESVPTIGIILGLVSGVVSSRVIRGATLGITAQPFVEVARSIGCTPLRIIFRYLLPNVFPIVLVLATLNIGQAIIAEASLSFIGRGVQPPTPSWGGMLSSEGRRFMVYAPWLFYAPTIALAIVVFCINIFGDALRDKLDPRLRGGK